MSYTDALARVSAIQSQMVALTQGAAPPVPATAPAPVAGTGAVATDAGSSGRSFSTMLTQAQGQASGGPVAGYPGMGGLSAGSLTASGLGTTGAAATGGAALPASAGTMLTTGQQQFASRLAAQTGLSPSVITAWLVAEENGSAAVSRQAAGNNDWLNIGYTDTATYGAADSIWSNPVSAADATAGWLKGQDTIPGYGRASSGVQAILSTAGQPPQAQIAAIQSSGWASSGYPDLPALLSQVGG